MIKKIEVGAPDTAEFDVRAPKKKGSTSAKALIPRDEMEARKAMRADGEKKGVEFLVDDCLIRQFLSLLHSHRPKWTGVVSGKIHEYLYLILLVCAQNEASKYVIIQDPTMTACGA